MTARAVTVEAEAKAEDVVRWGLVSALLTGVLLVSSCAGDSTHDREVVVIGADGNTGQQFSDYFTDEPGALLGMKGTAPLARLSQDFKNRLLELAPDLRDFNYSAESYDAVIVTALAAELARSHVGTAIAPYINAVTSGGEKCTSFAQCRDLINSGTDIDYDGHSGPLEFTPAGEPSVASYGVLTHQRGDAEQGYNRIDPDIEYHEVGDPHTVDATSIKPVPRDTAPTPGGLKFGALLSRSGPLAHTAPPMIAAVRLAINDLNQAGGVNGSAVGIVERDDATDPAVAASAADALLRAGVAAIIGCAGSAASLATIDAITGAGAVMFSPSNTSDEFTAYPDNGRYFRTAPPDVLQAKAIADLVRAGDGQEVVILHQETAYGTGLADNVAAELAQRGTPKSQVTTIGYQTDDDDFTNEVKRAKSRDPDHIIVIGYEESVDLIRTLNRHGVGPKR